MMFDVYILYLQFQWQKMVPLKNLSIKKWVKAIRQSRKDEERRERAEIHAAISVAGVAAALAAIAAADSNNSGNGCAKDAAVASAAALVAAQCAKVAQAMGAKREQLSTVIGSAISSTTATDILTLTAAASTCMSPTPPIFCPISSLFGLLAWLGLAS